MNETEINAAIAAMNWDTDNVSDGYHTFWELYAHRVALFVALSNMVREFGKTRMQSSKYDAWKSKKHFDDSMFEGWFIAGIGKVPGEILTYHLPIDMWDKIESQEIPNAPEWDGHTSDDVIARLLAL